MLVLSRQRDQSIVIGHDISVTVVEIRGGKVRLGIQAPKEVPVHRREVYEAIHAPSEAPPLLFRAPARHPSDAPLEPKR